MKVYLSGPIDFSSEESLKACKSWRGFAESKFSQSGIEAINPLRGDSHLSPGQAFADLTNGKALVTRDMQDICRSDIVLVCFPEASSKRGIGTLMEMMFAHEQGLPIIMVDPSNQVSEHPWVKFTVTEFLPSIGEACSRIVGYWHD